MHALLRVSESWLVLGLSKHSNCYLLAYSGGSLHGPGWGVPDQCRKTTVSSRYFRVGIDYTQSDGTAGTASPRRAAATAGCAVALRNFGQAEPKSYDVVDGSHSCSKIGQNGEYRWPR